MKQMIVQEIKDMHAEDRATNAVPLSHLFMGFLRLGLTAFGGPAMVAYIRDLAVKKKRWITAEAFQGGVALCQSIPGATAMQTAAYVGLCARGPLGALAAFIGFGLPAFLFMVLLSALYQSGHNLHAVISIFHGLQVLVIALIVNAMFNFGRASIKNWRDLFLAATAVVFLMLRISPMWAIVVAAIGGFVLYRGVNVPQPKETPALKYDRGRLVRFPIYVGVLLAVGLAVLFLLNGHLFDLSTIMLKVDLFAFGGGFTSVPLMFHEVVDVRHWLDTRTFMDGIALGQVTPGPIVITATFVGYQIAGVLGAIVGTIAVFSPSLLVLLATAPHLHQLQKSVLFRRCLRGVFASFSGLLLAVAINFGLAVSWNFYAVLIALAAFVALRLKVDILWVVLAGAGISVLIL
jgi:chromate transporter